MGIAVGRRSWTGVGIGIVFRVGRVVVLLVVWCCNYWVVL
jgi:hypothetical protein